MPGDEEAGLTETDVDEDREPDDQRGSPEAELEEGGRDHGSSQLEPGNHGDLGTGNDDGDDREEEGSTGGRGDAEEAGESGEDEDDGQGLTDEARSRGGKQSSREQERDDQGRFVGKD